MPSKGKIFSTRLDEATLNEMERVTRRLGISKRRFLEDAIQQRVRGLVSEQHADIWADTLGAWQRKEPAGTTIRRARRVFQRAFERHHRARHARVRG